MSWIELGIREDIIRELEANEYHTPTEVQSLSLKHLHNDLIVSARTGEGKTLCFLIPILQSLLTWVEKEKINSTNFIHALIVTPTRELAV